MWPSPMRIGLGTSAARRSNRDATQSRPHLYGSWRRAFPCSARHTAMRREGSAKETSFCPPKVSVRSRENHAIRVIHANSLSVTCNRNTLVAFAEAVHGGYAWPGNKAGYYHPRNTNSSPIFARNEKFPSVCGFAWLAPSDQRLRQAGSRAGKAAHVATFHWYRRLARRGAMPPLPRSRRPIGRRRNVRCRI